LHCQKQEVNDCLAAPHPPAKFWTMPTAAQPLTARFIFRLHVCERAAPSLPDIQSSPGVVVPLVGVDAARAPSFEESHRAFACTGKQARR
jgi:hypothetical protein